MDRRGFVKGVTTALAASLVPLNAKGVAAVPKVLDSKVEAPEELIAEVTKRPGTAKWSNEDFEPMVVDSEIRIEENARPLYMEGSLEPQAVSLGRREIRGSFTMYVDTMEQVDRMTQSQGPINLTLHQGPWKHTFKAYIDSVTIQASANALITADVDFWATEMATIEA